MERQDQPVDLLIDPPLRISFLPGRSDTLVVSLAGVGTDRAVQPPPEFFKLSHQDGQNHVLFVSDISRSWMNGPGIAAKIVACIEKTVQEFDIARVITLGNSMGGTMALLLAGLTRIDVAIAVAPQYSAHPDCVPEERRWSYFRKQIAKWPFQAVDALHCDATDIVILHGGTPDELVHLDRYPRDERVKHFVLPAYGHRMARQLHDKGLLEPIVKHAMDGRPWPLRRAVEMAGGITREAFDAQRTDLSIQEKRP